MSVLSVQLNIQELNRTKSYKKQQISKEEKTLINESKKHLQSVLSICVKGFKNYLGIKSQDKENIRSSIKITKEQKEKIQNYVSKNKVSLENYKKLFENDEALSEHFKKYIQTQVKNRLKTKISEEKHPLYEKIANEIVYKMDYLKGHYTKENINKIFPEIQELINAKNRMKRDDSNDGCIEMNSEERNELPHFDDQSEIDFEDDNELQCLNSPLIIQNDYEICINQ